MILGLVDDAQRAGARLSAISRELGISARTIERWRARPDGDDRRMGPHHTPANALTDGERAQVIAVMTSAKYANASPKQIVPALADAGEYLASESTMYRLRRQCSVAERRRSVERHHVTRADRLHRASGPNQVWSWDITYLPTLVRGRYFYLYLVIDVWSRRIVGWTVADHESASAAANLVQRICDDDGIDAKGLVLHSRAMRSFVNI